MRKVKKDGAAPLDRHRVPVVYRAGEVAQLLRCSEGFIYKLMEEGKLPYHHINTARLIREDDILKLLEETRKEG